MSAYLKDGTVKTVGLWDPGMLGYLGIYAAVNAASGTDLTAGFAAPTAPSTRRTPTAS